MNHNLAADKSFEGEGGEHVETETETGDVNHDAIFGEVIEHISLSQGTESKKTSKGHEETGCHGDRGAIVGYSCKAVDRWGFERAVNQKGIVVADECE